MVATTTKPVAPAAGGGSRWSADKPGRAPVPGRGRRRWPHLFAGVLLVAVCAVGGVLLSQELSARQPVLVLARPVTAGEVLEPADVTTARMAADPSIAVMDGALLPEVIGRPVAVDLRAGALLTEDALGAAAVPAAGDAVVAVAVEPGRFPPRTRAGSSVRIVAVTSPDTAQEPVTAPEGGWSAVVLDVVAADGQQTSTVITLRLAAADAAAVAGLPDGAVSVVLVAGGE